MPVVVTKGVKKNFDVVLAEIAALEIRMLVCLSFCNEYYHFAMSVRNEYYHFALSVRNQFICSNVCNVCILVDVTKDVLKFFHVL